MSGHSNFTNSYNAKAAGATLLTPAAAGTLDLQGRDDGVVVGSVASFVLPAAPIGVKVTVIGTGACTVTDTGGSSLSVVLADNEVATFVSQDETGDWCGALTKSEALS